MNRIISLFLIFMALKYEIFKIGAKIDLIKVLIQIKD